MSEALRIFGVVLGIGGVAFLLDEGVSAVNDRIRCRRARRLPKARIR